MYDIKNLGCKNKQRKKRPIMWTMNIKNCDGKKTNRPIKRYEDRNK